MISFGQETLDLQRAANMSGRRLDRGEGVKRGAELVPFGAAARRIADLEIADIRSSQLAVGSEGLYHPPDR